MEDVISRVCSHSNVQGKPGSVTIFGTSNGSGLLNVLLIQSHDVRIGAGISEVSQLSTHQFRDGHFWLAGAHREFVAITYFCSAFFLLSLCVLHDPLPALPDVRTPAVSCV